MNLLKRHDQEYNVDEISMNDKLTNCGHQIAIMEYAGFPFPTIALKATGQRIDRLVTTDSSQPTKLWWGSCCYGSPCKGERNDPQA